MLQNLIETERLYLKLLEATDAIEMTRLLQNPNVTKKVAILPFPYTESDAQVWIQKAHQDFLDEKGLLMGLFLKESMRFMGNVNLHLEKNALRAEIGYWLDESSWGKGYASECVNALLSYAFEGLKLNSVFATVALDNEASQCLLTKMGFKRIETRDILTISGEMRPSYFYELLQENFKYINKKEM